MLAVSFKEKEPQFIPLTQINYTQRNNEETLCIKHEKGVLLEIKNNIFEGQPEKLKSLFKQCSYKVDHGVDINYEDVLGYVHKNSLYYEKVDLSTLKKATTENYVVPWLYRDKEDQNDSKILAVVGNVKFKRDHDMLYCILSTLDGEQLSVEVGEMDLYINLVALEYTLSAFLSSKLRVKTFVDKKHLTELIQNLIPAL